MQPACSTPIAYYRMYLIARSLYLYTGQQEGGGGGGGKVAVTVRLPLECYAQWQARNRLNFVQDFRQNFR